MTMRVLHSGAEPLITKKPGVAAAGGASRGNRLVAYRDDGLIAEALGKPAAGRLPPLPHLFVALLAGAALMATAVLIEPRLAVFTPVPVLLLAGPASAHPHNGRLDWLVPPLLRAAEYGYLAMLGFAHGVSKPLVYALIAVLAYHHYDTVYRTRQRLWPARWVFRAGLGWDGRMFLAALATLAGVLPFVYALLTGYLAVVFGGESVSTWARTGRGGGVMVDLEEDEEPGS